VSLLEPGPRAGGVLFQPPYHPLQVSQERIVCRGRLELALLDSTEHERGVMPAGLPQLGVKPAEQLDSLMAPGPVQVVSDRAKSLSC
jgi:hypothetical protein